jgi:fumarate reductase flavoprotein subunit
MELGPRDRVSQAFVHEHEKGRTVDTPYGPVVYLDLRHLGADLIDTRLPFVRELCRNYQHIDPVTELVPVRPVVHYMMGGVHTDIHGATTLPGLYAAGETACVSINGANRLGSNSLPELLVFGARAGRAAAEYATTVPSSSPAVQAQARDETQRLERELTRHAEGKDRIADIRTDMQATLETAAGIYRDGPTLNKAVDQIRVLQERFAKAGIDDHSHTFNTELTALLELSGMLDIAQTIVESALHREESRGAHQRTDFPTRDDEHFLAHTLVHREPDGTAQIDHLPVTITRWPPGERVYGR